MQQRRNAIDALTRQAEAMREDSSAGDAEIKKLREYAVNSPDPKRAAELRTFAEALGAALYLQRKAAVELMRDIAIMNGREDAAEAAAILHRDNQTPAYTKQLQSMGDKLDLSPKNLLTEEGRAADHSVAATSGC